MDVQCEKCGTEYSLDETLVSPSGTSVRCMTCGHVFKALPPSVAGSLETWNLRKVDGSIFVFDRIATLQDWIADGKVSPSDYVRKGNGEWKRLGDIAEMKSFFDAAQAARAARPGVHPVAAGYQGTPEAQAYQATIRHKAIESRTSTAEFAKPAKAPFAASPSVIPPMARPVVPEVVSYAPSAAQVDPLMQTQVPARAISSTAPQADMSNAATLIQSPTARIPSTEPTQHGVSAPSAPQVPSMVDTQMQTRPMKPPVSPRGSEHREPDLSQIPASSDSGHWEAGQAVAPEGPAWAQEDSRIPAAIEDEFKAARTGPRRKIGRWIVLAVVLVLAGGAFYMFMYQRPMVDNLLGGMISKSDDGRHKTFYLKGRESFLLDTEAAFTQADREYYQVLALKENDALTLAALGQMYSIWAQYYLDREIDANVDAVALAAKTEGAQPDLKEAERLHMEFETKLSEARRWSDRALEAGPELAEAHLALADLYRLSGDLKKASEHLKKGRSVQTTLEADYFEAMLAIDKKADPSEVLGMLASVTADEPLLCALYREARVLASFGRNSESTERLARLLRLNSDHQRARDLQARIDGDLPILLHTGDTHGKEPGDDLEGAVDTDTHEVPVKEEDTKIAATQPVLSGAPKEAGVATGGSTDSLLIRASKLQQNGKTGDASDLFEAVLKRLPGNIEALSGLAYCYLDRGSKGQAIAHFRRALKVNPSYGPAIIGLAETYKAQGQKQQALTWYKKYLSVNPSGRHSTMARRNVEQLEQALGSAASTDDSPPTDEPTKPVAPSDDQPSSASDPSPPAADTNPPAEPTQPASGGSAPPASEAPPAQLY